MPAFLPITKTAIPWVPVRHVGNVFTYSDLTQAIPELRKTLAISLSEPSKTSKLYKVNFRITIPVEKMDKSVTPAVGLGVVDYFNVINHTLTFDARSTMDDRNAIYDAMTDFLTLSDEAADVGSDLKALY